MLPLQGARVRSLLGELGSHKPRGQKTKQKSTKYMVRYRVVISDKEETKGGNGDRKCLLSNFLHDFLKKYLFIYLFRLCWVLVAAPGIFVAACGLLVVACMRTQLQHACRILFPDKGLNLGPLHWEHGVLPTRPPGKSLYMIFTSVPRKASSVKGH